MKGPRSRPADSQAVSSDTNNQRSDVEASTSLAPPPRPAATTASDTPDYFNSVHNPFSLEPNPFEQSFGTGNSGETPGKSLLPPVAALTSPALPGASSSGGYNWSNSLRSGPLSPAMLPGPTGSNDYFDSIGRGFPTPNESSLRTGLTPGGGGSMFPAPSPNSQALLQQLQSGGATPSTIEFHRTALAAKKNSGNGPTSNANDPEPTSNPTMDSKPQATTTDFTQHDAADAANGLFMLAKGGQANSMQMNQGPVMQNETRSSAARRVSQNNNGHSAREMSGDGSEQELSKPNAKGKGKKNAPKANTVNNRRKADEAAAKGPNKKLKMTESPSDDSEDEEMKNSGMDPKKMTDEEKRRNFLERNRVAALKCRQRKKQWLANLQAKVELFTTENDALTATVTQLASMSTGFDPHAYGMPAQMGMPPGAPIPAQGMRRA
ncbi:putative bZIP transcription factor (AtfA) [Penicillium brasilianum]|uniref:Putative bZIP transcription factor (AtfA) n=1 Tax=Penicillium brasilianum TaxID=104259 RepID=A0A1S9RCZ5_PENBI|nr:putative bZIP transcription factor (AtfA) [Penicillium brasilianum]